MPRRKKSHTVMLRALKKLKSRQVKHECALGTDLLALGKLMRGREYENRALLVELCHRAQVPPAILPVAELLYVSQVRCRLGHQLKNGASLHSIVSGLLKYPGVGMPEFKEDEIKGATERKRRVLDDETITDATYVMMDPARLVLCLIRCLSPITTDVPIIMDNLQECPVKRPANDPDLFSERFTDLEAQLDGAVDVLIRLSDCIKELGK